MKYYKVNTDLEKMLRVTLTLTQSGCCSAGGATTAPWWPSESRQLHGLGNVFSRGAPSSLFLAGKKVKKRLELPILGDSCFQRHATNGPSLVWPSRYCNGPRPLNSTQRHGLFLKSTCHVEPSDKRNIRDTTCMGYFLNSTGDMGAS